jgi:hypothetical protein
MHEDYQLAYCPIAHITSLAFADDAFENTRLAPELLHKLSRASQLILDEGQPGMAKKRKVSSLDTPATALPIALTAPRRSQRETAVSDDDVESYQLPSRQFEVPVVLVQDSIASVVQVDLEPIPKSVL